MFPKTIPERGEDGKPVTAPRNFYAGTFYRGKCEGYKGRSSYFEKGKFNAVGDKYVDPAKRSSNKVTMIGDAPFKPQSIVKHPKNKTMATFEYIP